MPQPDGQRELPTRRNTHTALRRAGTDFRERSFVEGFPPRIIWLDVGNAGTAAIAALLRTERDRIEHFGTGEETSLLILSIGPNAV